MDLAEIISEPDVGGHRPAVYAALLGTTEEPVQHWMLMVILVHAVLFSPHLYVWAATVKEKRSTHILIASIFLFFVTI